MRIVSQTGKSLWAGPTHKKIKLRQYVILFHVKHCDIVSYNLMKGIK